MPQMLGHSVGVTALRYPRAGRSGDFPVKAVTFGGINTYLNRGAALTGAVDGEDLLISLWFNFNNATGDAPAMHLLTAAGETVTVKRLATGNFLQVKLLNTVSSKIYQGTTDRAFDSSNNAGWHHLLVAAQLDVTPIVQIRIDDVSETVTEAPGATNGTIDLTPAGADWNIGATSGGDKLFGDLAEVYMAAEFLDITVEANHRKFIDEFGFPVDLGSDGSTPTGTAPLIFLSGDTATWHTNKGSGDGFTENGALTDASSSPSD